MMLWGNPHAVSLARWWERLADGKYYPFQLRIRKAGVLHLIGRWDEVERISREDLERSAGRDGLAGFYLMKLGTLAAQRNDTETAHQQVTQALECYRRAGDAPGVFDCRSALINIHLQLREYPQAEAAAHELEQDAVVRGDDSALCAILNTLGLAAMEQKQYTQAMVLFHRKLEIGRRQKFMSDQASALGNIGCVLYDQGRYDEAVAHVSSSIAICRRIGDLFTEYYAVYNLGKAYEGLGRFPDAVRCYHEDLAMARQLGDGPGERTILADIERLDGPTQAAVAQDDGSARQEP